MILRQGKVTIRSGRHMIQMARKKVVKYSEKLVENTIKDFCSELLGEYLVFVEQQPELAGFRPDLLFIDSQNQPVIVEVQIDALDRNHLYRSLEYRDLYKRKYRKNNVRVILFCNSLRVHHRPLISTHNIECIKLSRDNFIEKLKQLRPDLEVQGNELKQLNKQSVKNFFIKHPVFTIKEFTKYLSQDGKCNPSTRDNLLAYHVQKGHLLRIKKGLYAVVPPGMTPSFPADPFQIASKMASDGILAYHTALDFHSYGHSIFNRFMFLTTQSVKGVSFQNCQYRPVRPPKSLLDQKEIQFGVETKERGGMDLQVTSLERTLVDLFDKPNLGGGWEEVWRSLESVESYNIQEIIEYSFLLNNMSTVAKVGYFLERNATAFSVSEEDLLTLQAKVPRQPHYMDKKLKGKLVRRWNLIVPEMISNRAWEEVF